MIDEAAALVGTAPQTVSDQPIRSRLEGEPWIEAILADHTECDGLAALARMLQDACYLVLAFLSGARDSEIKHLKRGGLTIERDANGTPYRWKMHSLAFKAEDDPAGCPSGLEHRRARRPRDQDSGATPACWQRVPLRPAPAQPRSQGRRSQPGADQRGDQCPSQHLRRLDQRLLHAQRPNRLHPRH